MPLVKVIRHGQITLPAAIRKGLQVEEGDYLEAELVAGTVVLRPKVMIDRDRARAELASIAARVRPTEAGTALSDDESLAMAVEEVKATRRELRAKRQDKDTEATRT